MCDRLCHVQSWGTSDALPLCHEACHVVGLNGGGVCRWFPDVEPPKDEHSRPAMAPSQQKKEPRTPQIPSKLLQKQEKTAQCSSISSFVFNLYN